jgi:hypothetical protein
VDGGAHVRGPAGDDPGMAREVPVVGRRHLDRHRRAGEPAQPPARGGCGAGGRGTTTAMAEVTLRGNPIHTSGELPRSVPPLRRSH